MSDIVDPQNLSEVAVRNEPVPTQEDVPSSDLSEPSAVEEKVSEGSTVTPTPEASESASVEVDQLQPVQAVQPAAAAELPLKWNLSGVWEVIPERSDSLNDFLSELGVGFMIRKLVLGAKTTTTIIHTPERYHLSDKSNLGVSETNVLTNGEMQAVADAKGKVSQIIAQCSEETNGAVYLQNTMPDKVTKTLEYRMLEKRDVMKQTVEVIKNGVSKIKITRYFAKQETPEECAANEAKWNATYPSAPVSSTETKEVSEVSAIAPVPSTPATATSTAASSSSDPSPSQPRTVRLHLRNNSRTSSPASAPVEQPQQPKQQPISASGLSLKWDLSGVWEVIPERSDSLNDFLAELGVGFMIRKLVLGAKTTTTIIHTPERYHLTDKSNLGVSETNVLTDGKMQVVKDAKGKESQIIAQCSEETNGAVYLHNTMPDKITKTLEYRMLEKRDVMKQTVEVIKNGVSKIKITRYFAKQETPEERAASEAIWNAAYAASPASSSTSSTESKVPAQAATEVQVEEQAEDPFPLEWNVSGTWVVIPERSDSLDGFLKELGLNFVIRKVVMGAKVVTTIVHTPERYHLTDKSNLGVSETNVLTNGKMQVVTDKDGKQAKIVARCGKETQGRVILETELPDGKNRTVEHRWLENRTVLRQQVEVIRGGVSKIKINRYFAKQETDEERMAGEKAWAARRSASSKSTTPALPAVAVPTPSVSVSVSSPASDKRESSSPLRVSVWQDPPVHALLVLLTLLAIGFAPRLIVVSGLMALGSLILAGDKAVEWFGVQAMKEERARQRQLKTNTNGFFITKVPAPVFPKERKSRTPSSRPSITSPT